MSPLPSTVSNRLHSTSIDQFVDDRMHYFGIGVLDLGNERDRAVFRKTLRHLCRCLVDNIAMDLAKGADRGIQQMANLIKDPLFYEAKSKRRKLSLERQNQRHDEQKKSREEQRVARLMDSGTGGIQ